MKLFWKRRIEKYKAGAVSYLEAVERCKAEERKRAETPSDNNARYSKRTKETREEGRLYSDRDPGHDRFDERTAYFALRSFPYENDRVSVIKELERSREKTFVEQMQYFIDWYGRKDPQVYKAADIDRRLYSKMISDRYYKPSRDTALAIAFALHLSLNDAKDLLGRAGYTLSHSVRRDIILEYFLKEKIYGLTDINAVLSDLGEKTIGR